MLILPWDTGHGKTKRAVAVSRQRHAVVMKEMAIRYPVDLLHLPTASSQQHNPRAKRGGWKEHLPAGLCAGQGKRVGVSPTLFKFAVTISMVCEGIKSSARGFEQRRRNADTLALACEIQFSPLCPAP